MTRHHWLAVLIALGIISPALAAPPQLVRITPPALQTGTTTTLILEGTELIPAPRIVLPVPIASQTVKEPSAANRVQIELKLAADVPAGVYQMRLANGKGISNPLGVEIDAVPPQPFMPKTAKLPAYLQGTLNGSSTLSTTIEGKKGQRLVIEAEARRLGSAIDPVIKVLDPRKVQVDWAQGSNTLGGDTRLITVLPADGTYTIELHDMQYRAGTPNRFRLHIGDFPSADLAFPLAGQRGTKGSFQLIGTVPETTRVTADLTNVPGGTFVRLPRAPGVPGMMPVVLVSDVPEVFKSEQAPGKPQEVTIPAGINGRIMKPNEEDAYRIRVQPGMKLRFDVLAERAGSLLDGVLILRNEMGAQLARSDDQTGTLDPGLEYTVPPGVNAIVAGVSDLQGRSGPQYVYRLAVTSSGLPDFTLALTEERALIPRNSSTILRVRATRTGYTGPIKLSLPGLPEGVTVTGDTIPEGVNDALLSFAAKDGPLSAVVLPRILGESTDPKTPLRRVALGLETPLNKVYPWLRSEFAVAVTDPGPINIAWESIGDKLAIGTTIAGKVKVTRSADAKGTIRLSLLTNQVIPKAKDNRTDDVNRSLRLEGMPTIPGILSLAEIKMIVPADLRGMTYDIAVKAEMLAADGRTVVATATTPIRHLPATK